MTDNNLEAEEIKELRAIVETKRVQIDKLKRLIVSMAVQLPTEVQMHVQGELTKIELELGKQ